MRFINPLRIGDKVSRTTKIVDQKNKSGSLGEMIFVDLMNDYYVDGSHCLSEALTLIYLPERSEVKEVAEKPAVPRPACDYAQAVRFSPHQLFRFSAITFNSHRIHFDPRHAQKVEAYPDQVVHGPIQTSIVFKLLADPQSGQNFKKYQITL